jgi:hypothetical protein
MDAGDAIAGISRVKLEMIGVADQEKICEPVELIRKWVSQAG